MCIAGCNIAMDSLSKPRQTIEIQYDIEANSENSTKEKGELARTLCRHVHRYSVSIRSRYKAILRSFAASHEFTTIYRSFQKPDQNSGANGLFKFTVGRPSLYRECLSLFEVHMASWFHAITISNTRDLFSPLEMQPKTLPFSPWHYKVQGFRSPSGCFMFLGFFDTLAFFPFRQQIHSSSSTTFLYSYCFSMKTWESRMLWHRITFKLSPDGWAVFRKQLSYFCDVIDVCTFTFALFQDSQGRWNACESVLNTLTRPQGSHVANWVV